VTTRHLPIYKPFIACHPDNLPALELTLYMLKRDHGVTLGLPIMPSPAMPKRRTRWEFPRDPFVEYEAKDERWARPLGIGREVDDGPLFLAFSDTPGTMIDLRLPRLTSAF
jgi:hypothetical protein